MSGNAGFGHGFRHIYPRLATLSRLFATMFSVEVLKQAEPRNFRIFVK